MVHTVDSYQGRQADIILISLVRNNDFSNITSSLGFLTLPERLNVMFSRVKKRMIIIGCSSFITKFSDNDECREINKIFQFVKQNGQIIPIQKIGGI
jgi:superfamily I DNA and/or RNA helicase